MESSRSKRQRLIPSYVSLRARPDVPAIFETRSNVSPQRPDDLPVTFASLNGDTKRLILEFVGNKSYATYAGINKHCKEIYLNTKGMTKETYFYGYAPLYRITNKIKRAIEDNNCEFYQRVGKGVVSYNRRDVFIWVLQLQEQNTKILSSICKVASSEGRVDILSDVWSWYNVERKKRSVIFRGVDLDRIAAENGKVDVLKWKRYINNYNCAEVAARYGHLNILQWLKEEKGLLLRGRFYYYATQGGHLHIMKWLKEQGCPWKPDTFKDAAFKGNLDILQWLHDEGCPWSGDYYYLRVRVHDIKPEVVEWLRANGYGEKVVRY